MYSSSIFAVLGLATIGSCHMKMTYPVPYNNANLDNSPLAGDGSNYPCKANGVYSAGATNTMPLGSVQTVSFIGSAVHGGGSCQFSVTYDKTPTASSSFKVIHSVEGGCPRKGVEGNDAGDATVVDPDTYSFTVPTSLPTGSATFAWTWFNKVGNREMYMNCAPIQITGATSKRSDEDEDLMARNITQLMERDQTAFNALPDMFIANIGPSCSGTGSCTQCQIPSSKDVYFPNPGDSVDQFGTATAATASATASGPSCGVNYLATGRGATAAASAPAATQPATQASTAPVATNTALSGGVFATIPISSASHTTSAPAASSPSSPASTPAAASTPAVVASTPVASSPAPASTGTTGSGTAITAGTACTTEGEWNCMGTSYQRCASGTWSVVMPLAAGTSCTPGQSAAINIVASGSKKRSIRFPRRNIQMVDINV